MTEFFYDSCTLILFFIIPGIFLGVVYDIFRVRRLLASGEGLLAMLRKRFECEQRDIGKSHCKMKFPIVFFEDFIFCIIGALTEILLFYHLNDGLIRCYGLMLSAVGFFMYRLTLSRAIVFLITNMIFLIRRIVYAVLCAVLIPPFYIYRHTFGNKVQKDRTEYDNQ